MSGYGLRPNPTYSLSRSSLPRYRHRDTILFLDGLADVLLVGEPPVAPAREALGSRGQKPPDGTRTRRTGDGHRTMPTSPTSSGRDESRMRRIRNGYSSQDGRSSPLDAAYALLQASRRRLTCAEFISCPGCGRLSYDLEGTVQRVKARFGHLRDVKIAVMGCAVNGPGEAKAADIGIAGGKNEGLIFVNGKVKRKVKEAEMYDELIKEINEYIRKEAS